MNLYIQVNGRKNLRFKRMEGQFLSIIGGERGKKESFFFFVTWPFFILVKYKIINQFGIIQT